MNRITRRGAMLNALSALAGTAALGIAGKAHAAWPERPVTLIVPYSAGGGADVLARMIVSGLKPKLGQAVVVENRAGAAGNIAMEGTARAKPDGYTLVWASSGQSAAANYYKSLKYDLVKDFEPVSLSIYNSRILVGRQGAPYANVAQLIAFAKKNAGQVTYASWGNGSGAHLAGELFKQMAGIEMLHVPYKGNADAITALLGGQVDVMFSDPASTTGHIRSGKLKAFGVPSDKRFPGLPEVPTFAEAGFAGFEYSGWFGILAPRGTPAAVVKALSAAVDQTLLDPDMREQLAKLGAGPIGGRTPEQFGKFLQDDIDKWGAVMRKANISEGSN
jgi:tripartite-type tricarboxylate transporter receptor subunit TctC